MSSWSLLQASPVLRLRKRQDLSRSFVCHGAVKKRTGVLHARGKIAKSALNALVRGFPHPQQRTCWRHQTFVLSPLDCQFHFKKSLFAITRTCIRCRSFSVRSKRARLFLFIDFFAHRFRSTGQDNGSPRVSTAVPQKRGLGYCMQVVCLQRLLWMWR